MSIPKQIVNTFLVFALFFFSIATASAQKVGLVLSGGAASGSAHIGVLKALEENHIPIDFITGTSMGALVGSLYAAGYSPLQIEALVKTEKFRNWSDGIVDQKYAYYFKRNEDDASWFTFKLSTDSSFTSVLPTNFISPIAMDFGMMELAAAASANAGYNFDSLFIPFRCVASDVEKKESVVFRKGDLAEAVRASMSYPFYIRPISVDGKLLFDGGLYNNFPSNVMYQDFFPDFIIGSTVTSNNPPPSEDDLLSQIKSMLQSKSKFDILCEGGVIIEPKTNVGLFDFNNPQPIIDSGYVATIRKIKYIKQFVERRSDSTELYVKRLDFKGAATKINFDNVNIEGLNKYQADYAKRILLHKNKIVSLENVKEGYFRLASDNKIKYIYPKAKYNSATGYFDLLLKIKKEKKIITYFGGNFSNRPISQGYIGFQYNYLGRFASSYMLNGYFGKLYTSVQIKTRLDFAFKTPVFIEPSFTWNKFDYYKSSNAFTDDVKPAFLVENEEYGNVNVGLPTGKKSKFIIGLGGGHVGYRYYQTSQFTQQDTADRTNFNMLTSQCSYEINTLNHKQYANQGEFFNFKIRYVNGEEKNIPGSTSTDADSKFYNYHEWLVFRIKMEKYFNRRGTLKIGLSGEGVYSTQTLFNNYTASILSAQAFQPTPDSKTVFLENYRAHKYLAGGIKLIVNVRKNIELRAEGHIFQPYQTLVKTVDLKTVYGNPFALQHYIATGALVWHTLVGPMSLSLNYYDQQKNPFSILFHFGYIIFNKRALE